MQRINIVQGEHAVAAQPGVVLTTLLGSCVAVCLHDHHARVGGMNHFLLAEPDKGTAAERAAGFERYGVHAMEVLVNALLARGAARERLRAHIYGGATMIAGLGLIGQRNADFARRFVAAEGIALGHCDIGGSHARRVEFLPHDGKVRALVAGDAALVAAQTPQHAAASDVELF